MAGYIPSTARQQREMLAACGFESFDDLFADIPECVRLKEPLRLPEAMSELEVTRHLRALAGKNRSADGAACFLGAGAYDHYIPAAVHHITARQEFATAYTPYQPEISQGTLQAIFEYQTLICELTGMDVANASMYDGATALAEAARMACDATKRKKLLVAQTLSPLSRRVAETYAHYKGCEILPIPAKDGVCDPGALTELLDTDTAAVLIASPNFYGCIEDLGQAAELAHRKGALLIASVSPIPLAVLRSPGELGADIAVGEGQSLGTPLQFGGPYFGFFAAKNALLRKMPGRIVGKTADRDGKPGYVLTLQAREQHIRREKATSNICTNEALNALAATVYLSLLGKEGLREVALQCFDKAHYACRRLTESGRFKPAFSSPFFLEFTVRSGGDVAALNAALLEENIIGGLDAGRYDPSLAGGWILAVTEKRTRQEIDRLVEKAVAFHE